MHRIVVLNPKGGSGKTTVATNRVNIAANAIPLKPGDKILVADTEYLQVSIPWKMKEESKGVEIVPVRTGPDGMLLPEDFERAMDSRTKVATPWQ